MFAALLLACLESSLVFAAPTGTPASANTPYATVSQGVLSGSQTTAVNSPNIVNQYLGVPFAVTPPQRFFPPEDPVQFDGTFPATTLPPACLQEFAGSAQTAAFTQKVFGNPGGSPLPESEDCLYLNIWQPTSAPPAGGFPVMFWIFGGNLDFGSGSLNFYNGASFAATQDIILVTHNYRTNVFGAPNAPQIPDNQQNAGLLDQRKALEWVYKNIAAFEGNPDKITIFGESAGGYSVLQLLGLPDQSVPVAGAIVQSQGVTHMDSGPNEWNTLASNVSCGATSNAAQLACMQAIDGITLRNAIDSMSLSFGPINNGLTATNNVQDQMAAGTFARVPLLMGTNSEEARVFLTAWSLGADATPNDLTTFLTVLAAGDVVTLTKLQDAYALEFYVSAYHALSAVLTDVVFLCSTSALANKAADNGYQVWRYWYNATFPNEESLFPDPGVFHSSEIPSAFGNPDYSMATAQQIALAEYMQGVWAGFAKNPTAGPPWPAFGQPNHIDVVALGGGTSTGATLINSAEVDNICPLVAPLAAALSSKVAGKISQPVVQALTLPLMADVQAALQMGLVPGAGSGLGGMSMI